MSLLSLVNSLVHGVVFTCGSCSFGECWLPSYVFYVEHIRKHGFAFFAIY